MAARRIDDLVRDARKHVAAMDRIDKQHDLPTPAQIGVDEVLSTCAVACNSAAAMFRRKEHLLASQICADVLVLIEPFLGDKRA